MMEVRSTQEPVRAQGRKISGYAAVYDAPTTIQDYQGRKFTEIVRSSAFRSALESGRIIKCLYNHNPDCILGSTKSGTLQIHSDNKGLRFECELPDTQVARDLIQSIERGDVDGCSWQMQVRKDQWSNTEAMPTRELLDVDVLEVGPTPFQAYQATSLDLRSAFPKPKLWRNKLRLLRLQLEEI